MPRAGFFSTWVVVWWLAAAGASSLGCRAPSPGASAPSFGELIHSLSEPGGYFDTDNLVSNETSYVQVLERLDREGGAYIGVGPEQNFSYIGKLRPRWAFIVDIRRDNMLHHLLLNAILARADTPREYLAWLFSRPLSGGETSLASAGIAELIAELESSAPSRALLEKNLQELFGHIETNLGFALSTEDREILRGIYESFFEEQLEIRFRSHGRPPMSYHPSYRSLITARMPGGVEGHFLASPEEYGFVRDLSRSGRLVPVVGDFAGDHALRAVGRFLAERGETVSAFYVSNVEYYLIRSGRFPDYVENLKRLPLDERSLFIRAYFNYGFQHPAGLPGHRSTIVLQPILRFLGQYEAGAYRSYWDICTLDYIQ